jgi:molybdopterin-containing oxidoreductase family iron-sulfur binding subunit
MKLCAASMALAGLDGCAREHGAKILPYSKPPRTATPGVPRYYATSLVLDGYATGVLVESHDGRPTKIEGNPDHPASLGATTAIDQAAVLGLYDPDRARSMRVPTGVPAWERIYAQFAGERADHGAGLRLVLEPTGSPLVGELLRRIATRFPAARITFHSPAHLGNRMQGARIAFGAPAQPLYDFRRADVVLALDDDFLASGPFSIPNARAWAERRHPNAATMSRLYVVETMLTPTGSMADHRFSRRPSEIGHLAARVAAEVAAARKGSVPREVLAALEAFRGGTPDPAVVAIARDLVHSAGAGVVTVGEAQPPTVHALGHLMNVMLDDKDTAWTIDPTLVSVGAAEQDLTSLAKDIDAHAVDTVVILEGNPVYTAPRDLDLARRLSSVPHVLYLGEYENETAACAGWFVPATHALEQWADATAYDGTVSIVQPLIRRHEDKRTVAEVLAMLDGQDHPDARTLLQHFWDRRADVARWEQALRLGLFAGTASPKRRRSLAGAPLSAALKNMPPGAPPDGIEVRFAPDPAVQYGQFSNNPWLLEQPRPFTHLTWDNAALMSVSTAARLGLADEDVVDLELDGRRVRAPVLVVRGHADDAVTLHLGWGREGAESLARGRGFDAYALRTSAALAFAPRLIVRKRDHEHFELALTQLHDLQEDRPIALAATLAEYKKDPQRFAELRGEVATMLPPVPDEGEQWAMTIDMSICTACSACVLACQAENNILVVGKEQVVKGREMHWLRIDTYLDLRESHLVVVNQPMMCQHCERAPCEYVCPVNATVHSPDGLNEMVYNRCVGTRFCSNNCPYKVRRFNWFDWETREPANVGEVSLQRNPDVTVRQRGVMEKCSYCVQRIREVEIHARIEDRAIRPGEVVTACQQACPTGAIQFGSLRHKTTRMVEGRDEQRAFNVLHELGTSPRTRYLARIDNPNKDIG